MKLTPQLRVILMIAAVAVLVIGISAALLYPQYQKYQDNKVEAEQLQTDLLAARTMLAYRTQLEKNHPALVEKIEEQEREVPKNAELTDLIRTIQDLAFKNDHWMTSIKNTDPVEVEDTQYNAWNCEITLEGNWLDTLSFLHELRDMDRQVRVNTIEFTRAVDLRNNESIPNRVAKHWDPEAYPVRTVITASVYYIPDSRLEKAEQPAAKTTANSTATTTEGGAQ